MENLMLGLKVAAIGIVGVFTVLLILMASIKSFEFIIASVSKKAHHKEKAQAPVATAAPVAVASTEDESEVVAVITAAIMAILQSENQGNMPSFQIKKIKQIKRN